MVHCAICGKIVDLKLCKTDEEGRAVHEDCYEEKMQKISPKKPPGTSRSRKKPRSGRDLE